MIVGGNWRTSLAQALDSSAEQPETIVSGQSSRFSYAFTTLLPIVIFVGLLALSVYLDAKIQQRSVSSIDGPQVETSRELWSYIRSQLPPQAIVVFRKPFVMSLYGNRTSNVIIPFESDADLEMVEQGYRQSGVTHFVVDSAPGGGKVEYWLYKFVSTAQVKEIWRNSRFILYGWAE